MSTLQYGGGCINEVCNHLIVKGVPFNGTGHSGMGSYHALNCHQILKNYLISYLIILNFFPTFRKALIIV